MDMHELSLLLRSLRKMDGLFLRRDDSCPADIAALPTILSRSGTCINRELRSLIDQYNHRYGRLTEHLKALPEDKLEMELRRLLSKQYDPKDLGFSGDEAEMLKNLGWG